MLCGVQTPNCIRATAVDALGLDYEVGANACKVQPRLPLHGAAWNTNKYLHQDSCEFIL